MLINIYKRLVFGYTIHNDTASIHADNIDNVPKDVERIVIQEGVKSIGPKAFQECHKLSSVTISNSVTTIHSEAFAICPSLTLIAIPGSVTAIGRYAFKNCPSLVSITLPDSVTIIELGTFSNCISLASITIPDSVTTIQPHAFSYCSSLASIVIPDSVSNIGRSAFYRCSSLASLTIPNSVTIIERNTFNTCTSLTSFTIPTSVTTIGNDAFSYCSALTSIAIPDSVTTIGYSTFEGCSSLASIAIPNSVITIGNYTFSKCTLLNQRQTNGTNFHHTTTTWLKQRFTDMPIHQACYNYATQQDNFTTQILTNLIKANNDTNLASIDAMGMTALHVLCCNPNAPVDAIKVLKDAYPHAASMRNVAGMTPLMMLFKCEGISSYDEAIPPLVSLLEVGIKKDVLEILVEAFDEENELVLSLERKDEASNLLPFMQAASLAGCALDVVYMLASKRPDLLQRLI